MSIFQTITTTVILLIGLTTILFGDFSEGFVFFALGLIYAEICELDR